MDVSCLRITIPEDIEDRIDKILEAFFIEAYDYDTYYPGCWRYTIIALHLITNGKKNPFTKNATDGIHYLFATLWNTVCRRCDIYVFKWLYDFSKAWLLKDEFPIFVDCTCSSEDD